MGSRSLELNEFIAEYPLWGKWKISYTDGTHLPEKEYVKLGDITIDTDEEIARRYPILPFTFSPVSGEEIKCRFSGLVQPRKEKREQPNQAQKEKEKREQPSRDRVQPRKEKREQLNQARKEKEKREQPSRAQEIISDQLADSMVRTGLIRPEFCLMEDQGVEMGFLEVMKKLSGHGYLILVADTSALRRAVISFLHKTLSDVLIWTVVPIFVMTEVQRQALELSKIWRDSARGKNHHLGKCDVLEKRPQVSVISRELNHIRQWRPVEMLTTLSEHLGQSNGNSNTDRLIIESVKNLKRDRGLHQGVYLITGDKDMASLATLENQGSLHIGVPSPRSKLSSVRYDSHNSRLVLTPVHYLLWDLAQVFSTIRFKNKELGRKYELAYYSQACGGFFAYDVMEIREL